MSTARLRHIPEARPAAPLKTFSFLQFSTTCTYDSARFPTSAEVSARCASHVRRARLCLRIQLGLHSSSALRAWCAPGRSEACLARQEAADTLACDRQLFSFSLEITRVGVSLTAVVFLIDQIGGDFRSPELDSDRVHCSGVLCQTNTSDLTHTHGQK